MNELPNAFIKHSSVVFLLDVKHFEFIVSLTPKRPPVNTQGSAARKHHRNSHMVLTLGVTA